MGEVADDMWDNWEEMSAEKAWCEKHQSWYFPPEWGCPVCEEEAALEDKG